MHSTALLPLAFFAALSNAIPQTSPAPAQAKAGAGKGAAGGLGGLLSMMGISTPPGADGPDLRGIVQFLRDPNVPKGALTFLDPLFKVPDIQKFGSAYLDFRNLSALPFIVAMPYGPKPTGCAPYEILIARGTGEVGEYGFIVGDPLLKRVQQLLPEARGYAVQYPANSSPNSSAIGSADVLSRITSQHALCPTQKFAVAGYSQGSFVMRSALSDLGKLGASAAKQVVGGAMFGGPGPEAAVTPKGAPTPPGGAPMGKSMGPFRAAPWDRQLVDRIIFNCAKGDFACGGTNILMHLTYNNPDTKFMPDSAAWIVSRFKGEPVPAAPKSS